MSCIGTLRRAAFLAVLAAAAHAEPLPSAAAHSERGEDGSFVFRLEGDFFTPSAENQMKTWNFKTPEGKVFKRLVVGMDVTPAGWWSGGRAYPNARAACINGRRQPIG